MDVPHRPSPTDERPLSKITGTGPGPYHHAPVPEVQLGGVGRPWWQRVLLLLVGLALFVTALGLMKEGARSLIPALEGSIFTDNGWSALGVGFVYRNCEDGRMDGEIRLMREGKVWEVERGK